MWVLSESLVDSDKLYLNTVPTLAAWFRHNAAQGYQNPTEISTRNEIRDSSFSLWTITEDNKWEAALNELSRQHLWEERLCRGHALWPLQQVNAGQCSLFSSEWLTVTRHLFKDTKSVTHLFLISNLKRKWTEALKQRKSQSESGQAASRWRDDGTADMSLKRRL